jgi:hypothetical protein
MNPQVEVRVRVNIGNRTYAVTDSRIALNLADIRDTAMMLAVEGAVVLVKDITVQGED